MLTFYIFPGLEQSTGLPPRERVQEPQRALLAALAPAKSPAPVKAKPAGPCDKCDGPHATDDCPHFKKPRDDHKDAYENYQKAQKTLGFDCWIFWYFLICFAIFCWRFWWGGTNFNSISQILVLIWCQGQVLQRWRRWSWVPRPAVFCHSRGMARACSTLWIMAWKVRFAKKTHTSGRMWVRDLIHLV